MFCVAVGFAGNWPGAQLSPLGLDGLWLFIPRAVCVATPAHAGKRFSKNGMGLMVLTSVATAAAFERMGAAWKYFVPLVESVRLVGIARSTCIGRRRPTVPT